MAGNPRDSGPELSNATSSHFDGKRFHLPGSHDTTRLTDVLRWKLTSRPTPWPKAVALRQHPAPPSPRGPELVATWLGHASFLIQIAHHRVLLDPVFSERVSPFTWVGPRRVHQVPIPLDQMPPLSAVCVSHDHYDHCDIGTLRSLASATNCEFIAPLRHRDLLVAAGVRRVVELDWWQTHAFSDGLTITLTPTKHWSNRLGTPRNHRLWGGFWLRTKERAVWFVGDSGYDEALFREIRRRCGTPDLALVPIGAYEPRWFMAPMHMNPDEAVRLHRDLGAKISLGMHWGTFQLTDEGRDEPVRALDAARTKYGVAPETFQVIDPGESVVV